MWTAEFWKAAAERGVKTFAQALAAALLAGATGVLDADWQAAVNVAAMAAVLSLLTSIGSAGIGNAGPSLATEALPGPVPPPEGDEG